MNVHLTGVKHQFGREVSLTYPDLTVNSGEHAVMVGPSGSGKTTALHFIAGLLIPSHGAVHCGGTEVSTLSEAERDAFRARHIGYVFQDFHLLPGYTALENVLLGLRLAGLRGRTAHARAHHLLEHLGLARHASQLTSRLSTGERQRVALARAVAHTPQLLLADEPTAHLDRSRAQEALSLLRDLARSHGATLLVVSHDPLVTEASFDQRVVLTEKVPA